MAEGFTSVRIIRDTVVLAVSSSHRLAGSRSVCLEHLHEEDFLLFSRTAAPIHYDALLAACRFAGLEPNITQHVDTRVATLALVAADLGITLSTAASQHLRYPSVAFCRIENCMPDVGFWLSYPVVNLSPVGARLVAAIEDLR